MFNMFLIYSITVKHRCMSLHLVSFTIDFFLYFYKTADCCMHLGILQASASSNLKNIGIGKVKMRKKIELPGDSFTIF